MTLNKVMLIGNVGDKPLKRTNKNGNAFYVFSLATDDKWARNGEDEKETDWHSIVVGGGLGSSCEKYLEAGSKIYVEGKVKPRTYEDKEGVKHTCVDIVPSTIKFLDGKTIKLTGAEQH